MKKLVGFALLVVAAASVFAKDGRVISFSDKTFNDGPTVTNVTEHAVGIRVDYSNTKSKKDHGKVEFDVTVTYNDSTTKKHIERETINGSKEGYFTSIFTNGSKIARVDITVLDIMDNIAHSGIWAEGSPEAKVTGNLGAYYEYDWAHIVKCDSPDGDAARIGPVVQKDGKRRFPKYDDRNKRQETILGTISSIQTGAQQWVYVLTTQPVSILRWFENTRLLIIEPNSHVDFNVSAGGGKFLVLRKGRINEDKDVKKAAKAEEVMSLYAQVADLDGYYGMTFLVDSLKLLPPNSNNQDALASSVIKGYVVGAAGYAALCAAGPVWLLPADFANTFVSNMVKAQMAYALRYVYTGQKADHDELQADLCLLFSGEPNKVLQDVYKALDAADKNFIGLADTAIGVAELTKLTERMGKTKFVAKVMEKSSAKVTAKIAAKGVKAIPVLSTVIGAAVTGTEVTGFGKVAKDFYRSAYEAAAKPETAKQPTVTSVKVSPAGGTVNKGATKQFSATVTGANNPAKTVTWSLSYGGAGGNGTSISSNGLLTVGKDQLGTNIFVKATSTADTSQYGTVSVTVPGYSVNSVTVSPAGGTVSQGSTKQFSASVTGDNNPAKTVTWSLSYAGAGGKGTSINSNGLLTIGKEQPITTIIVKATSTADASKYGTVSVDVPAPAKAAPAPAPAKPATQPAKPTVSKVTVSPATATVNQGSTKQFSASVTGDNNPAKTVTWSLTGASSGTSINEKGLLTVGANQNPTTLTVKATSTADTSKGGTASVTVAAPAKAAPAPAPAPAPAKMTRADYQAIIQARCKFSNPANVWKALDTHAYADALYKTWAESYPNTSDHKFPSAKPANKSDQDIIQAQCKFSSPQGVWDAVNKHSDPKAFLRVWASSYYKN